MKIVNRLVHKQTADLDLTFAALADAVRRAVIARLAKGDEPVTVLAIVLKGLTSCG